MGQSEVTEVIHKLELDGQVAELLGLKRQKVAPITKVFLERIANALVEQGAVLLPDVGLLRIVKRTGVRQHVSTLTTWKGEKRLVPVTAKFFIVLRKAASLSAAIRAKRGGSLVQPDEFTKKETSRGQTRSRRTSGPGEARKAVK